MHARRPVAFVGDMNGLEGSRQSRPFADDDPRVRIGTVASRRGADGGERVLGFDEASEQRARRQTWLAAEEQRPSWRPRNKGRAGVSKAKPMASKLGSASASRKDSATVMALSAK